MKRTFTVTLELDTDAPVDPLFHRNRPSMDLGPDAIYVQLNGLLETSGNLRVSHVAEADPDLEMPRMLVLSTKHISEETVSALNYGIGHLPAGIAKRDHGWLIPIYDQWEGPDDDQKVPADLVAIRDLALANGCTWICLDSDGDILTALPAYDW